MSRPPFSYPLTRIADGESGGVADLQTDVMRFMAILAICLVAIFALVQSIPLDAQPPDVQPAEAIPEPAPQMPVEPVPESPPAPIEEPAPSTESQPVTERQGFTLQFESDLALTRLTARNEVALYAIGQQQSLRLSVNRGRLSFWPASTPNQFFEMDADTVPADVLAALRTRLPDAEADIQWGVTLPNRMQQQLNEFLSTESGGALFIGADGTLRLE
ncbi:MAG: hypothetical protein P8X81_11630 [Woeseiaceae bacterium]|jgi:hypothetical protein